MLATIDLNFYLTRAHTSSSYRSQSRPFRYSPFYIFSYVHFYYYSRFLSSHDIPKSPRLIFARFVHYLLCISSISRLRAFSSLLQSFSVVSFCVPSNTLNYTTQSVFTTLVHLYYYKCVYFYATATFRRVQCALAARVPLMHKILYCCYAVVARRV